MLEAAATEPQNGVPAVKNDAENEGQEEDGDWDEDGEYDEEDEEDIDAEAAEIARKLEAELWADIQANSGGGAPAAPNALAPAAPAVQGPPVKLESPQIPSLKQKKEAAVATIRAILASLENDSLANSTFAAASVPEYTGSTLLDILQNIAYSGKIPKGVALPISRSVVSLAKSDALFASLRHSEVPSIQLKRKREETVEIEQDERASKRLHTGEYGHPLHAAVADAVRVISQTFYSLQKLEPALIASIKPQLYCVHTFALSSSVSPGPHTTALQEIGGLIQVLGVLSGIEIAQAPSAESEPQDKDAVAAAAAAAYTVHPCLASGCGKFFAHLSGLRTHARVHIENGAGGSVPARPAQAEEGEIESGVILAVQATALKLRALLQAHVARALGAPAAQGPASSAAPANGQATLLGAISQAQHPQAAAEGASATISSVADSSAHALPAPAEDSSAGAAFLSLYGLSAEQTKQFEEAIASASTAAEAVVKAQAALEEEEEEYDTNSIEEDEGMGDGPLSANAKPPPPAEP